MVRSIKQILKKSAKSSYEALLIFRTTPLGNNMPSPAELLFGRKVQANLPIVTHGPNNDHLRLLRENSLAQTTEYYDQHSRSYEELEINRDIYYQDVAKKQWMPGKIIGIGPEPRSYVVQCDQSGRTLCRNRVLLKPKSTQNVNTTQDISVPETMNNPVSTEPHSVNQPVVNIPTSNVAQTVTSEKVVPETLTKLMTPTTENTTRSGRVVHKPQRLIENC
jgi:hypothetical protein